MDNLVNKTPFTITQIKLKIEQIKTSGFSSLSVKVPIDMAFITAFAKCNTQQRLDKELWRIFSAEQTSVLENFLERLNELYAHVGAILDKQ